MPLGQREACLSFAIGDNIYIGGGSENKQMYMFNTITSKWTRKADLPATTTERSFGNGFAIGNKGYICFGQDGGQANVKDDLWQYDTATDAWTQMASLPGPKRDAAFSFVVGGKAYVGGGISASAIPLDNFYSYDPATNTWKELNTLPTMAGTSFAAAFSINGVGYLTTGAINNTDEFATLYAYNAANDSWSTKASFTGGAREAATAFSLGGKGYVGLGFSNSQTDPGYTDFYAYDPVTDSWSAAPSFAGTKRGFATATSTGNAAFVAGGWDFSTTFSNDLWKFTPPLSVSTSTTNRATFTLSPNPAHGIVTLHATNLPQGEVSIAVSDVVGRIVYASRVRSESLDGFTLDASAIGMQNGVYFVRITSPGFVSSLPTVRLVIAR